jgi:transcriptional regulator of acetoin/glycerol metabolism
MSWKSEHMKYVLPNGDFGTVGHTRHGTIIAKHKKICAKNDTSMRKRSEDLYGSTKYTDAQIVYFYRKHKGNVCRASADLGMSYLGFRYRMTKLGLDAMGSPIKYTDKQVTAAMEKSDNYPFYAAKLLGCNVETMKARCRKLGLPMKDRAMGPKGISDEEILYAWYKEKGNKSKAANRLNMARSGVYFRLAKIEFITTEGR